MSYLSNAGALLRYSFRSLMLFLVTYPNPFFWSAGPTMILPIQQWHTIYQIPLMLDNSVDLGSSGVQQRTPLLEEVLGDRE